MQDSSTIIPTASTAAGVAMLVTVVAIPMLIKASEAIKYKYNKYNKVQIVEIKEIRQAYKEQCWVFEKDHSLTTLDIRDLQRKPEDKEPSNFPIYFCTRNNDEIPELFYQGFCPVRDFEIWRKHISKSSPLKHPIEEMIGYICHYQLKRDERFIANGYNYDPTNMFFEELKIWLIKLSTFENFNEQITKVVYGRYKYLGEIYAKGIFSPGDSEYTRIETVKHIMDIFKNIILPAIKLSISRKSSREHFSELKTHVESNLKLCVKLLFYIYRDTPDTPYTFIFEQIREPNVTGYINVVNKTISGQLLKHLVSTPVMCHIFKPSTSKEGEGKVIPKQSFCQNDFEDKNGCLTFPLTLKDKTALNWYEFPDEKAGGDNPTGILFQFRSDTNSMQKFLYMHCLVQKLSLFHVICENIYDLSGDGGNILVYGALLKEVSACLERYKDLIKQIRIIADELYDKAEIYKSTLMKKNAATETNKITQWNKLYYLIYTTHDELEEGIASSLSLVQEIEMKIIEVNSKAYQDDAKKRYEFFYSISQFFSFDSREPRAPNMAGSKPIEYQPAKITNNRHAFFVASNAPDMLPVTADVRRKPLFKEQYPSLQSAYAEASRLRSLGDFEESYDVLERMCDEFRCVDNIKVRLAKAAVLIGLKKYEKALNNITFVLESEKNNSQAKQLNSLIMKNCFDTASECFDQKNYDLAETNLYFLHQHGDPEEKALGKALQTKIDTARKNIQRP